jgi:hypothetical protein
MLSFTPVQKPGYVWQMNKLASSISPLEVIQGFPSFFYFLFLEINWTMQVATKISMQCGRALPILHKLIQGNPTLMKTKTKNENKTKKTKQKKKPKHKNKKKNAQCSFMI